MMLSTQATSLRALSRASYQATCPAARRLYATNHDQRTKETLKISSQLTWLTATAAIGATALYYTTSISSSSSSVSPASSNIPNATHPLHNHDPDAPKPVEDRHGNSVEKHSIAAHKNQDKIREGKFSGRRFDNHVQTHSPGTPGGDFEER